jgi:predicted AAA+ superfamily ATPase
VRLTDGIRVRPSTLTKRDYVARALRGGYPEAVRRDPGRRRARFFDSYVTDLVARDVQQISDIERPAEMRRLLSVVAARMGQTLSRYLDLLELVLVIKRNTISADSRRRPLQLCGRVRFRDRAWRQHPLRAGR